MNTTFPQTGTAIYDAAVGKLFCDFLKGAAAGPNCPTGGTSATNRFFPALGYSDYTRAGPNNTIGNYLAYFDLPGAGVASSMSSGSEAYYDVVLGNLHVFMIDSEAALRSSVSMQQQRAWLEQALRASSASFQAVVVHDPPYSSGARYGSATEFQWPYAEWGADLVLSALHRGYERVERNGISYVTIGLGGDYPADWTTPVPGSVVRFGNRTTEDTFAGVRLDVTSTTLRLDMLTGDGRNVDTHTITRGTPPPTTTTTTTSTTSTTSTTTTASTTTTVSTTTTAPTTTTTTASTTTTTLPPFPGSFSKSSPSNGSRNVRRPVTLSWGASSNVVSYQYCIDTVNNGACDSSWVSTGTARSASVSLGSRRTYYWQVRASNSRGQTAANSGSWWNFTTR